MGGNGSRYYYVIDPYHVSVYLCPEIYDRRAYRRIGERMIPVLYQIKSES